MTGLYTLFWLPSSWGAKFEDWEETFLLGFYILIGIALLLNIIYYLILGRSSSRHSNLKKWFLFLLLNMIVVVVVSVLMCGYGILGSFSLDSWSFSFINGLGYGPVVFLLWSLIMNNFTIHSKYIPFRIFK
jgi:hypothetical protein